MTAPITSREELLKNHTMPDLPCPVCGTLCRADVVLRHKQAISDNAQGVQQPIGYLLEKCGHDNGYYFVEPAGYAHVEERFRSFYTPVYALPSTGLPAPAPHAEVREALEKLIQRHASAYVARGAAISDSIIAECKASREALLAALALPQSRERGAPVLDGGIDGPYNERRDDLGIVLSALRYLEKATGKKFDDEGGVIAEIERDHAAPSPTDGGGK